MNSLVNADMSDEGEKSLHYCKDFIRGLCPRDNCKFIHEKPPQSMLKDMFRFCHDFQNKGCFRTNCKFIHCTLGEHETFMHTGKFPRDSRHLSNYVHPMEAQNKELMPVPPPPPFKHRSPNLRDDDEHPVPKFRRLNYEDSHIARQNPQCHGCNTDQKMKILEENSSVLMKQIAEISEKNSRLTSMVEYLLEHTATLRSDQSCVITSRHGTSAPVSLATVSVTPVVSLGGALPTLVPAAATPNLGLAPAASRAQLLTPAPQILTVSTTQQLVGNSGALIVTSAGAQQLMQVSDSGTLMGGGQTVVAVPAQLTLAPPAQQLMSNASQTTVQQLVQQSTLQTQLAPQHQAQQYATQQQHLAAAQQSAQQLAAQQSAQHLAAQQSAQHLAAQQSAQHLAAQQSVQHLAAQQSAQQLAAQQSAQHLAAQQSAQHMAAQQSCQHLAAQQSAQHAQHLVAQQSAQHLAAQQSAQHLAAQQSAQQLAAQQSAQQQLVPSAQQLVHQTSTHEITISSTSQPMALPNSQAQPLTFPMMSQNILPH